jgi:hypothetical protein
VSGADKGGKSRCSTADDRTDGRRPSEHQRAVRPIVRISGGF